MNFQNIPRDDKVVKRCLVSKLGVLHFLDYSQIEPRLTAYFAAKIGHPEFAEALRAGQDPYTTVAKLATAQDTVTPEEREVWKRIFLGLAYGAGAPRVREVWMEETQTVISLAQAKQIVKKFHANWPAVRELQDDVIRIVQKRGYIKALDGRHLHPEEYGEHKLLNKLIQGSAAGIMKQAILAVHDSLEMEGVQTHAISVIHDELILDGPPDEAGWVHDAVPTLMANAAPERVREVVPILVDHEVSLGSWADKQPYEEVFGVATEA